MLSSIFSNMIFREERMPKRLCLPPLPWYRKRQRRRRRLPRRIPQKKGKKPTSQRSHPLECLLKCPLHLPTMTTVQLQIRKKSTRHFHQWLHRPNHPCNHLHPNHYHSLCLLPHHHEILSSTRCHRLWTRFRQKHRHCLQRKPPKVIIEINLLIILVKH